MIYIFVAWVVFYLCSRGRSFLEFFNGLCLILNLRPEVAPRLDETGDMQRRQAI